MHRWLYKTAALVLVLAASPTFANDKESYVRSADNLSSSIASHWFGLLYAAVKAEKIAPPQASRIYGVAAVALYEAIVSGSKENRSLAGQLNGLSSVPSAAKDVNYHWPTVVNTLLANTARGLIPTMTPNTLGQIRSLEQKFDVENRAQSSAEEYARSAGYGRAVNGAILAWAATDGFTVVNSCAYANSSAVSHGWRPTPPSFMPKPLQPCWGQLRPMVLKSGQECAPTGPPKFSNNTNSEFYAAAMEVYKVGLSLTSEQKTIADYWADNPGDTGTPPGHWIDIVTQIARKDNLSLGKAAEAYARVGIAVYDAFISCWHTKYVHNLKRPVTYINENVHGQWRSYVATPNFPSYPSGHSVQSAAAARVLTDMFGEKSFTDTTHADHKLMPALRPRTFKSFNAAAAEAAVSRLHGGIHYSFDNNDGLQSGECIGDAILDRVKFRR